MIPVFLLALLLGACAAPGSGTLARLPPPPAPPSAPIAPDLDAAIDAYRAFLAGADPSHPAYDQALARLAELELARGSNAALAAPAPAAQQDTRAAIARLQDLVRRHPNDPRLPWWLYQLGRAHHLEGRHEAALAAFERLLADHPRHELAPEAAFRSAEIRFARGDYAEAQRRYLQVLAGPDPSFHELARYKLAWARLKQGQAQAALDDFLQLYLRWGLDDDPVPPADEAQQARRRDLLRGLARALDRLGGGRALIPLHARLRHPHRLHRALGDAYRQRERWLDAAQAYLSYGQARPRDLRGLELALRARDALRRAGLRSAVSRLEERLLKAYRDPALWQDLDAHQRRRLLTPYLDLLARLGRGHHARAQRQLDTAARQRHGRRAAAAYRAWLALAGDDHPQAPETAFLLAETLQDLGEAQAAAARFRHVAYRHPRHPRAPEAAYAALLIATRALRQAPTEAERAAALARWRDEADRFLATFGDHPQARRVLAERLLDRLAAGEDVRAAARPLIERPRDLPLVYAARLAAALGDWAFAAERYPEAARHYRRALAYLAQLPAPGRHGDDAQLPPPPAGDRLQRRLAVAHHRAAQALAESDLEAALAHYRAAAERPVADVARAARRDALDLLVARQRWAQAWQWLQRQEFEEDDVLIHTRALILARLGRHRDAARTYQRLAETARDPQLARAARLEAARQWEAAGDLRAAVRHYKRLYYRHRLPPLEAQRTAWTLAERYLALGASDKRRFWLRRVVRLGEAEGAPEALRPLAARAALALADALAEQARAVALRHPLERHLRRKQRLLEQALAAYRRAAALEVAEVVTAATHHGAELHLHLARALLAAPLPPGLDAPAQERYRLAVEELAAPFEEQAIALHQANAARAREGLYDRWVAASFARLAELYPARYDKREWLEVADARLP